MSDQLNRCKFTSDTTGTGSSIHFVAAASAAFLTPTEAGIVDGRKYTYVITQGNDFEIQQDQVWTASGSTIARGTPAFSKIGGTAGTTKITLDNTAVVSFGASALDLMFNQIRGADVASASTIDLTAVTGKTVLLTGTTNISTVTMNDGQERWALYTGAGLTLTVGSNLIGNTNGANVTLVAGDMVVFKGFASSVVRFYVMRLTGKPAGAIVANDISDATTYGKSLLGLADAAAARSSFSAALKGQIYGLTLSNNVSDATNDIDIDVGEAASTEAAPVLMVLASSLTKRLDASWSVGTNQGGLDTGSIANTTYHLWLIRRSDTGVVDALFSASATAPTMPTNYDQKRLIGSIIRASGAILPFVQSGESFELKTPIRDVNASSTGTSAVLRTLSVPTGRVLEALFNVRLDSAGGEAVYISNPAVNDLGPSSSAPLSTLGGSTSASITIKSRCFVNTSAQVRSRMAVGGATETLSIATLGWVDRRGRDG
jgi:hypothetical protein